MIKLIKEMWRLRDGFLKQESVVLNKGISEEKFSIQLLLTACSVYDFRSGVVLGVRRLWYILFVLEEGSVPRMLEYRFDM